MKAHIRAICQTAQPAFPCQNIILVTSTGLSGRTASLPIDTSGGVETYVPRRRPGCPCPLYTPATGTKRCFAKGYAQRDRREGAARQLRAAAGTFERLDARLWAARSAPSSRPRA